MRRIARALVVSWTAIGLLAPFAVADTKKGPASRAFRIDYGATLRGLPKGSKVRVWLPVPQSNEHQKVRWVDSELPANGTTTVEPKYGNKILYFESSGPESGNLTFKNTFLVNRMEVRGLDSTGENVKLTPKQRELFLSANDKVPLTGKQTSLVEDIQFTTEPLSIARKLYNRVDDHVRYDKSQPGYGNGDVLWVCDSRTGNCTDFHSLFISLARSKGLPARFEIGFPLPPGRGAGTIGGYHCWALFHDVNKGWIPVDISEADKHPEMKEYYFGNLTADRVTFTTGRDIDLVPKQEGKPLNYFVYPYVEVDGIPLPKKQFDLAFSYTDVN